jgi:hypothetical protein
MHHIYRLCCAGLALAAHVATAAESQGSEFLAAESHPAGVQAAGSRAATADWTPVSTDVLERARGGFELDTGVALSFGLERLVSQNGNVVSHTTLQIPDMTRMSAELAEQTREALSGVKLIQIGHDNIYVQAGTGPAPDATVAGKVPHEQVPASPTLSPAQTPALTAAQARLNEQVIHPQAVMAPAPVAGMTVIQNSLNDQVIRSQTVISASVNSMALLQGLRLERSLSEVIAGSANPH